MAHKSTADMNTDVQRPLPIYEVWLAVEEEQTMHFGMRRSWRWMEERPSMCTKGRHGAGKVGSTTTACVQVPRST